MTLSESRIREIVREELEASSAQTTVTGKAELAIQAELIRHRLETLMDDLHMPDDVRESFIKFTNELLG